MSCDTRCPAIPYPFSPALLSETGDGSGRLWYLVERCIAARVRESWGGECRSLAHQFVRDTEELDLSAALECRRTGA